MSIKISLGARARKMYQGWNRNTMGNAHDILCNLAASILERSHYNVEMEKSIIIPEGGPQKRYVVDVYGERDGDIIIYECGSCNKIKLTWLRKHIGCVIHMPYLHKWFSKPPIKITKEEREYLMLSLAKKMKGKIW